MASSRTSRKQRGLQRSERCRIALLGDGLNRFNPDLFILGDLQELPSGLRQPRGPNAQMTPLPFLRDLASMSFALKSFSML